MSTPPFDLLILSNGPGELSTWVRPVVGELVHRWPSARISVILAPDSNSSGRESETARSLAGVSRVQGPEHYLKFLFTGRTAAAWDWCARGVVLFLGGDQGFSAWIAHRLGYPIVAYAEWQARWPRWFAAFGLREEQVRSSSAKEHFPGQFRVIGDLMIDSVQPTPEGSRRARERLALGRDEQLVLLLPGSKPTKLSLGIPLFMGVVAQMHRRAPNLRFCIPVAPGLTGVDLARYGRADNGDVALVGGSICELRSEDGRDWLVTPDGGRALLDYERPAFNLMVLGDFAITTVGANTAELGILGVPMLVVVPTNRWDVMRAWDGLPGLLSNLPGIGTGVASFINRRIIKRLGLLAWPNKRAGRMLVPELVKVLVATDLVEALVEWLAADERRRAVSAELRRVMGAPGAARAFVELAAVALDSHNPTREKKTDGASGKITPS